MIRRKRDREIEPGLTGEGMDRREFMGRLMKIGAGTVAAGVLASYFISKRDSSPEFLKTAVEVTDLVEKAGRGENIDFGRAVEPRLSLKARMGLVDAREAGWTDGDFTRLLAGMGENQGDVKKATRDLLGVDVGFKKFFLIFDPREDAALTSDFDAHMHFNPVAKGYGRQDLIGVGRTVGFHEIVHVLQYQTVRTMTGVESGRDFLDLSLDKHLTGNPLKVVSPEMFVHGVREVNADVIGLKLAENRGMGGEFKNNFRGYAEKELSRYEGVVSSRVAEGLEVIDLLSIRVAAEHFGYRDLADRLGETQAGMVEGIAGSSKYQRYVQRGLLDDFGFIERAYRSMAGEFRIKGGQR